MIAARHPLAKLASSAILVLAATVFDSLPGLGVIGGGLVLVLVGAGRRRPWAIARRMAPFFLLACAMSWVYLVAENPAYRAVGGHGAWTAAVVAARILVMGLASLTFVETTRPDELARALEQNAGLPRRFVQGVLAAIQLIPALADDYRMLRLLQRSAGSGARPARLRSWISGLSPDLFLLLFAGALRRADAAALSMQLRGLDRTTRASPWRRRDMGVADGVLVAGACGLVALAALLS